VISEGIIGADGRFLPTALEDLRFYMTWKDVPASKIDGFIDRLNSGVPPSALVAGVETRIAKFARSYEKARVNAPKGSGPLICDGI
jgi:hypothetical protein